MHFTLPSALFLVGMASALPSQGSDIVSVKRSNASAVEKVHQAAAALSGTTVDNQSETSDCVGSLLCCGSLTTPLDHIVDPILEDLGINAAKIVGSVGLLCDPYESSTCSSAPQCCTEANLLGGTLALGCAALKK
ncbi:Hydrophobin [Penicillium angulare]|uniref:Hydrophobin n=1 Tax=Penicillium angulare TaxID=116970 RepID=UPI002540CBAC|nr:Hydrophobin [Penicillium angulare]KAJ5274087.1 Hydrophobin [Penicillium angulare]